MGKPSNDRIQKWKFRAYQMWALIGAGIIAVAILYVCQILWQAVSAVILTVLIVLLLYKFVASLQSRGISRALGVGIAYLILLVVLVGIVALLLPALVSQLSNFASNLPHYAWQFQDFFDSSRNALGDILSNPNVSEQLNNWANSASSFLGDQASTIIAGFAGGFVGIVMNVGNGMLVLCISLICAAWVLIDMPTMQKEIGSLLSKNAGHNLRLVSSSFGTAIYGWIKSTLICAIILGIISGLVFWALQIPYSALLGALCAILYLIPYIGPTISMIVVAALALFVGPLACILSIVANGVISFVVGNIISPRLMQSSVSVHPTITLIAILIGGALGGAIGMLLSIPTAAALQAVFVKIYEDRTGKILGTKDGALFRNAVSDPKDAKEYVQIKERVDNLKRAKEQIKEKRSKQQKTEQGGDGERPGNVGERPGSGSGSGGGAGVGAGGSANGGADAGDGAGVAAGKDGEHHGGAAGENMSERSAIGNDGDDNEHHG